MSAKVADTVAQDEASGSNEDERQKRLSMIVRCTVCDKKLKLMVKAKERMKTLARTVTASYEEVFGTPIPERIMWFTDSDGFAINPRSMLNEMVGPDATLIAVTTTEPEPVKQRKKPGPKSGSRTSTATKEGEPAAKKSKTTTKAASKTKATTKVPTAKKGRPPKKPVTADEVETSEDEAEAKPNHREEEEEEEQTFEAEVVEEEGDSEDDEDDEEEEEEEEQETLAVPEVNGGEDSEDSDDDDTESPMAMLEGDANKEATKQPKKKAVKRTSVHKAKKDFGSSLPSTPKPKVSSNLGKRGLKKKVTSPKKPKTKPPKKQ